MITNRYFKQDIVSRDLKFQLFQYLHKQAIAVLVPNLMTCQYANRSILLLTSAFNIRENPISNRERGHCQSTWCINIKQLHCIHMTPIFIVRLNRSLECRLLWYLRCEYFQCKLVNGKDIAILQQVPSIIGQRHCWVIWAATATHASVLRRGDVHTHWLSSPERDKFHWTIRRTVKVTKRFARSTLRKITYYELGRLKSII